MVMDLVVLPHVLYISGHDLDSDWISRGEREKDVVLCNPYLRERHQGDRHVLLIFAHQMSVNVIRYCYTQP